MLHNKYLYTVFNRVEYEFYMSLIAPPLPLCKAQLSGQLSSWRVKHSTFFG